MDDLMHASAMMDGGAAEAHAVVRRFVVLCSRRKRNLCGRVSAVI